MCLPLWIKMKWQAFDCENDCGWHLVKCCKFPFKLCNFLLVGLTSQKKKGRFPDVRHHLRKGRKGTNVAHTTAESPPPSHVSAGMIAANALAAQAELKKNKQIYFELACMSVLYCSAILAVTYIDIIFSWADARVPFPDLESPITTEPRRENGRFKRQTEIKWSKGVHLRTYVNVRETTKTEQYCIVCVHVVWDEQYLQSYRTWYRGISRRNIEKTTDQKKKRTEQRIYGSIGGGIAQ